MGYCPHKIIEVVFAEGYPLLAFQGICNGVGRLLGLIGGQRGASGPHRFCRSTALPATFCPEGEPVGCLDVYLGQ